MLVANSIKAWEKGESKMKRIQNVLSSLTLIGLLIITATGCMVSPGDQQAFADRTKPIAFSGFTVRPGQKIELFAMVPTTGAWEKFGEASSNEDIFEYFGAKWHFWNQSAVVPKKYWFQWGKGGGYSAVIKAMADKNDLFTFKEGFYNYYEDYDSVQELFLENRSQTGVEILIWAEE